MSDIRYDNLHNRYVIIAPERLHRPIILKREFIEYESKNCPFCEGHEDYTPPEIFAIRKNGANQPGWKTRVVPNLYKAVQIETANESFRDGFFEHIKGFGAHEIIIDTPCHNCKLSTLSIQDINYWLQTISSRISDLQNDKRLIYINVFKNSGERAGASQPHPHTQLIALPVMAQNALEFLKRNHHYYLKYGRGIVEDIVYNEKLAKVRVVKEVGNFIAYCPYASSFSFEVIIAPTVPLSNITKCTKEEFLNLAELIKSIFSSLDAELGNFDYNLSLHIAPININFENEEYIRDIDKNYRFYIRIMPRIYTLAGFEISAEMAINSVPPELCAKLLRGE